MDTHSALRTHVFTHAFLCPHIPSVSSCWIPGIILDIRDFRGVCLPEFNQTRAISNLCRSYFEHVLIDLSFVLSSMSSLLVAGPETKLWPERGSGAHKAFSLCDRCQAMKTTLSPLLSSRKEVRAGCFEYDSSLEVLREMLREPQRLQFRVQLLLSC